MQFGRYYEEFEPGAVYKHWPGKTVTEYDDHLFCLITMNHHPLHLDAHYAAETTQFGRNVVVGNLHLLAAARHVGAGRQRQGDRQPRGRVAQARRADLPRRHDLRRDPGARQDRVQVQGRPRHRLRRDQGLQPGRHAGLHLPAQGHGAQARRTARPAAASSRAARCCARADRRSGDAPRGQGLDQAGRGRPARAGRPSGRPARRWLRRARRRRPWRSSREMS